MQLVKTVEVPRSGWTSTEGTVLRWLKKEGDPVERGEIVCEIETEKSVVEVEARESGILRKIVSKEGATVRVGQVIGVIGELGEEIPEYGAAETRIEPENALRPPQGTTSPSPRTVGAQEMTKVSPAARNLARECGVDVSEVHGTGPNGRIVRRDILSHAKRAPGSIREDGQETLPLRGWRKVMAERMSQSKRTAAHITTIIEVDATNMVNLRASLQQESSARITYTAFFVRAVAKALKEHPLLRATLAGDEIIVHKTCDVGVAIARKEGGLIVPVIHNADEKNLVQIARSLEELRRKAEENRFFPEDLTGAKFTITNPGVLGVILDTPIINPPESAILSAGKIVERTVVSDGKITIRPALYLCLSYDHRIIDGLPAIEFLQRVRTLLEQPERLASNETLAKS